MGCANGSGACCINADRDPMLSCADSWKQALTDGAGTSPIVTDTSCRAPPVVRCHFDQTPQPTHEAPTLLPRQPLRHKSLKVNVGIESAKKPLSTLPILQPSAHCHKPVAKLQGSSTKTVQSVRFDVDARGCPHDAATAQVEGLAKSSIKQTQHTVDKASSHTSSILLPRRSLRQKSLKVNVGIEPELDRRNVAFHLG